MGRCDAACAVRVALQRALNFLLRQIDFFCEIPRDQVAESLQGDTVRLFGLGVKPVGEMQERPKTANPSP